MYPKVFFEVTRFTECSVAVLTFKGPLSSVKALVYFPLALVPAEKFCTLMNHVIKKHVKIKVTVIKNKML